jgi:hypothetical protein
MGHEIFVLFLCPFGWCPDMAGENAKWIGPIYKYSSKEACEKAATEFPLKPSAPADENGRHYFWILDSQGRIMARSDEWWECRLMNPNGRK